MLIVKNVERMCRMGVTGREISDRHDKVHIQCKRDCSVLEGLQGGVCISRSLGWLPIETLVTNGNLPNFTINFQWTLFSNWWKESWQNFEETSGYVRPERVNKWPTSMTDIWWWWWWWWWFSVDFHPIIYVNNSTFIYPVDFQHASKRFQWKKSIFLHPVVPDQKPDGTFWARRNPPLLNSYMLLSRVFEEE